MDNKKISVLMIGNHKIEESIKEISQQSYQKDMELLVFYQKGREEKIEPIQLAYPMVKFIGYDENLWKSIQENKDLLTGDFISILNSEDSVSIDYYRTMVATAIEENADIVISNSILQYADGGRAYLNLSEASLKNLEREMILEEYLKQAKSSFLWRVYGNKIYTKELFEKTLQEVCQKENVKNYDFFLIMFGYSRTLRMVKNEVLFHQFEETELESDRITKIKTAWNDNLEKLKKEIINSKTKIVSFDIFDTLIIRPFWNPIDLFVFLNQYFREITKIETGMDFSKIRVEAEKETRRKNKAKQEITLDEIYEEIQNQTKLEDEIIEKMKQKEQELEIKFCTARKTGKEIYELAKYLGKTVIATSDMYLPMENIKKILDKNDYKMDNIYLSAQIGVTKFCGDLYSYVIKDLQVEPGEMVHIGDNYHSDYEKANQNGINGQFLPKAVDVFCNKNITNALGCLFNQNIPIWENNQNGINFLGIRCMLALVANSYFDNPYRTFHNETDFNADPNLIGYYALGMHLFGIADWLLKDTKQKNYEKIVFFARDGYWMMKAYQILKKAYDEAPEEEYLYISRRALVPATLNNPFDFYKLSELIDIYKYTPKTILKYIKNIVYDLENLEEECQKIGIDVNQKFEIKSEFNCYMNLIINKFYDKKKHEEMLEKLKSYFSHIFSGKACAFDIGYSAKPEMYLSKLCGKPIDAYFVNISNEEALEHAKIGGMQLHTYFDYRPAITGVVREILISTSDPSCIGYELGEDNQVIPIFEGESAKEQERFILDAMQNKAIEFITDITNIFGEDIQKLYYQRYYISLPHEMYINSPKKLDQEIFYGVDLEDAVGLGERITAIEEWNREIEEKKQKRTTELFHTKYTEKLEEEKKALQEEIKVLQNEKDEMAKKYQTKEEEINKIYNSKKWKYIEKMSQLLRRKKIRRNLTRKHKKYKIGKDKKGEGKDLYKKWKKTKKYRLLYQYIMLKNIWKNV